VTVAIVTGGSRGIGAATVALLAERGWDVCFSYRQDEDAARAVSESCGAVGIRADMSTEDGVLRLFALADEMGPLRVLVNNAGIVDVQARVDELSVSRIERMLAVNVVGPFVCAREAVRRMSTRHGGDGGVIVNVGSAASRGGGAGQYVDYAASKGAIDTMTIGLAKEVAAERVRVCCVRPGIVDTEIHASGGQPDRARRMAGDIPMQRPGRPEEIAAMIVWLCSDEASYVTGAIFDVSGGR
jgi:NAD(P)-dependent dehydrogenase (short-subunit alcohol dehydrogenase family)